MANANDALALSHDIMFKHLVYICDALEAAKIPYFLSSGTLLGAVREGNILKTEERDIDLDITQVEVEQVLGLNAKISADGYEIIDRVPGYADFDIGYNLRDMKAEREPVGGAGLLIMHNGEFVGDIFINAIYSDGFARRQCLHTDASVAAKMTVPAWYYEGHELAKIRGRDFPVPRLPKEYLRKTYGDDWGTPIAPGQFGAGRHPDSGTVYDSDMERLTVLALEQGWDGDYSDFPEWPREVKYVGSYAGRRWIFKHETFFQIENTNIFTSEETAVLKALLSSELTPFREKTLHALITTKTYIALDEFILAKKTSDKTTATAKAALVQEIADLKDANAKAAQNTADEMKALHEEYMKARQHTAKEIAAEKAAHEKTAKRLAKLTGNPIIKGLLKLNAIRRKILAMSK